MFDRFTEKLVENALSMYSPKLGEISKIRADELSLLRAKIRTSPEEVEVWFDKEIAKIGNIDFSDIIKRIQL